MRTCGAYLKGLIKIFNHLQPQCGQGCKSIDSQILGEKSSAAGQRVQTDSVLRLNYLRLLSTSLHHHFDPISYGLKVPLISFLTRLREI